jgi:hypothetical protein
MGQRRRDAAPAAPAIASGGAALSASRSCATAGALADAAATGARVTRVLPLTGPPAWRGRGGTAAP